jgi:hypothetical protein
VIGTSAAFQAAISGPHEHIARLDAVRDGAVVRTLNVHSGEVSADRSGRILRRFTASVADAEGELTPEGIRDLLAPFGTTLRGYRGVRIPTVTAVRDVDDTQTEWSEGTRAGTVANAQGELVLGNT